MNLAGSGGSEVPRCREVRGTGRNKSLQNLLVLERPEPLNLEQHLGTPEPRHPGTCTVV
jgi:hypothetical protein